MFRRKTIVTNPGTDITSRQRLKGIGISLPFNNPKGIFLTTYINREQVLSNLKNLLMTAKGERYFQPDFGTDIRTVLFENITDEEEFKNRLKEEIQAAISYWLPYLIIDTLTVSINMTEDGRVTDSSHAVGIFLRVSISQTNIYLPIRIFISETANIRIVEEAQN